MVWTRNKSKENSDGTDQMLPPDFRMVVGTHSRRADGGAYAGCLMLCVVGGFLRRKILLER